MSAGRISVQGVSDRTCGAKAGKRQAETSTEFRLHDMARGRRRR